MLTAQSITALFSNKPCWLKQVTIENGLVLGFGKKFYNRKSEEYYPEIRILVEERNWRAIKNGKIILGSDKSYSLENLENALRNISFGNIQSIETNTFDVRFVFDEGICLDIMAISSRSNSAFLYIMDKEQTIQYGIRCGFKLI